MRKHRLVLLIPIFLVSLSVLSVLYVGNIHSHYNSGASFGVVAAESTSHDRSKTPDTELSLLPKNGMDNTGDTFNSRLATTSELTLSRSFSDINVSGANVEAEALLTNDTLKQKEKSTELSSASLPGSLMLSVTRSTDTSPPLAPVIEKIPAEPVLTTYGTAFEEMVALEIHRLTNIEREDAGVAPLTLDDNLATIAAFHSNDMALNDYFAHTAIDGCSYSCRFDLINYPRISWGENIAWRSETPLPSANSLATILVKKWMASTEHRLNMLSDIFTHEGIGVAIIGNKVYATADFALPK